MFHALLNVNIEMLHNFKLGILYKNLKLYKAANIIFPSFFVFLSVYVLSYCYGKQKNICRRRWPFSNSLPVLFIPLGMTCLDRHRWLPNHSTFPHLSYRPNISFPFLLNLSTKVKFIRFLVTESSLIKNHIPVLSPWNYSLITSISILGVFKLFILTFTIFWFMYIEG